VPLALFSVAQLSAASAYSSSASLRVSQLLLQLPASSGSYRCGATWATSASATAGALHADSFLLLAGLSDLCGCVAVLVVRGSLSGSVLIISHYTSVVH